VNVAQVPEPVLAGDRVRLLPVTEADVPTLLTILRTPEVSLWWPPDQDLTADLADDETIMFVIEAEDEVVGMIQYWEEQEPDYRHASIDLFLGPKVHRRGYGSDAIRTLARYLFEVRGHHRLTIDPAADNTAAIACYEGVGFRRVGVLRQYWRDHADGMWRDGVLLDLLRPELR